MTSCLNIDSVWSKGINSKSFRLCRTLFSLFKNNNHINIISI